MAKGATIEVKSLDVWSVGKIYGAICAVIGFIIGLVFGLLVMGGAIVAERVAEAGVPSAGGVGAAAGLIIIILAPIIYGILGMVIGIICALVYNFVADKVGGIKFKT